MSFVTHLSCPRCRRRHNQRVPKNLCDCGSPLLVEYDLPALAHAVDRTDMATRPPSMWRYREFLPVESAEAVVSLGEGFTPLIPVNNSKEFGIDARLFIKDEGLNPTQTFKARGASCGISRAVELGISNVALPTAGNAGGAWACYGAAAGIRVHIAMPRDAPDINKLECQLFGADLELVDGLISDAGRVISEGCAKHGWFDASTLKEPYRIEGKKTLGLEIAEQLGWNLPDVVIYPAGGGVGAIGIHRAFKQLRDVGWVSGELPRMVVVQSKGCAPLVKAFNEGRMESEFWPGAKTLASGLRVPKPLGDFIVLDLLRETNGIAVEVDDQEILEAMDVLAKRVGLLAAPEGAAGLAAANKLSESGWIHRDHRVVMINTGSGTKYPEAMMAVLTSEVDSS